jgi:hypothetical protein
MLSLKKKAGKGDSNFHIVELVKIGSAMRKKITNIRDFSKLDS